MKEATLTRSQLQAQTADFMANGGKAVKCDAKSTKQIIEGLKPMFKVRTIETWVKSDMNRLRGKKK